jgi:hypothetical protein
VRSEQVNGPRTLAFFEQDPGREPPGLRSRKARQAVGETNDIGAVATGPGAEGTGAASGP